MIDQNETTILDRLRLLEKRIEELEKIVHEDMFLDEYLKVQGFK